MSRGGFFSFVSTFLYARRPPYLAPRIHIKVYATCERIRSINSASGVTAIVRDGVSRRRIKTPAGSAPCTVFRVSRFTNVRLIVYSGVSPCSFPRDVPINENVAVNGPGITTPSFGCLHVRAPLFPIQTGNAGRRENARSINRTNIRCRWRYVRPGKHNSKAGPRDIP